MQPNGNTESLPIRGYNLYWDQGTGVTPALIYTGDVSVIYYTSSGLVTGLTYAYQLSCYNAIGESAKSSISVIAALVPSAIKTLKVTASTNSTITISWTAPDNGGFTITNYLIWSDQGNETFVSINYTDVSNTSYTFSSLT